MHEAVFGCLVAGGTARYSVYLSYRSVSEAPLARLMFDELNHRSLLLRHCQHTLGCIAAVKMYAISVSEYTSTGERTSAL